MNDGNITDLLASMSFTIDSLIEMLIQNGTIDKDEFKNLVYQKIDQGEDEEAKVRIKERLDKLLEHKLY